MPYYSLEKLQEYRQQSELLPRQELPPFQVNERHRAPSLYRPSPALADAVNVALRLGMPLLLTGEPGTGKTELAYHLSWFFGQEKPLEFHAKTSSVASDLFYRYDALGHFQYSQSSREVLTKEELERRFIQYVGLGEAIRANRRCLVLIDEIDKAPRDLPNDVLHAIDKLEFQVPELDNKPFKSDPENKPVVIITSNSEKNLPDAFLRRVVYFHIEFPDSEEMLKILAPKIHGTKEEELRALLAHFYKIREQKLNKKPATAELIQWASCLHETGFPLSRLNNTKRLSDKEIEALQSSYSILAKNRDDLATLLKVIKD
jgi:MoxR-like ATPase